MSFLAPGPARPDLARLSASRRLTLPPPHRITDRALSGLAASALALAAALGLGATEAQAQCRVDATGASATCSGTTRAADLPARFEGTAIGSVTVTSSFAGTAEGTSGIVLQRTQRAPRGDLSFRMESGARLRVGPTDPGLPQDAVYVDNDTSGSNTVIIDGEIDGTSDMIARIRGVRLFSRDSLATDINRVHVGASGSIRTSSTAIWVNKLHTASGQVAVEIDGTVFSNLTRAVQVSANNPTSDAPVDIRVGATGQVSSPAQAIYVGNAGTGRTAVEILGRVEGGAGDVPSGAFGPQGGVIFDTVTGAALTIGRSGSVSALNDRAIADVDGFRYTPVAGGLDVENQGRLTGFVEFGGGDDTMRSSGTWVLRNYADSDGDGRRDRVGDVTAAFGGGTDRLINSGTMVLASLAGGGDRLSFTGLETFVNAGRLSLSDADGGGAGLVAGDLVSFDGDYVGQGGTLVFDSEIGGPGAATDRLRVAGDVSGTTRVEIIATGRPGVPDAEGLLLIEVGGTSEEGAFALDSARPVEAGAFVLDLARGTPGDAADQNWYLRTSSTFGSGAAIYESAPTLVLDTFGRLPSHDQRMGRGSAERPDGQRSWTRIASRRYDVTPERSTAGARRDTDHTELQLGLELARIEAAAGHWILGVTGQYGRSDATVTNAVGQGSIEARGGGVGATATWYGLGGTYADLQLQVNRISLDLASASQGTLAEGVDATLLTPSIEVGHRLPVGSHGALIPQGQISHSWFRSHRFTDDRGVSVDLGDTSRTTVRLGLAYEVNGPGTVGGDAAGEDRLYVIGNLLRDFGDGSAVDLGGATLEQEDERLWGEIGIGASFAAGRNAGFYAEGSYRRTLDTGAADDGFAVTAGVRLTF